MDMSHLIAGRTPGENGPLHSLAMRLLALLPPTSGGGLNQYLAPILIGAATSFIATCLTILSGQVTHWLDDRRAADKEARTARLAAPAVAAAAGAGVATAVVGVVVAPAAAVAVGAVAAGAVAAGAVAAATADTQPADPPTLPSVAPFTDDDAATLREALHLLLARTQRNDDEIVQRLRDAEARLTARDTTVSGTATSPTAIPPPAARPAGSDWSDGGDE